MNLNSIWCPNAETCCHAQRDTTSLTSHEPLGGAGGGAYAPGRAPVAQSAEADDSKSFQCGFESHPGYGA